MPSIIISLGYNNNEDNYISNLVYRSILLKVTTSKSLYLVDAYRTMLIPFPMFLTMLNMLIQTQEM